MLFCRCREGVRVELALRLAPGIHSYGPNGVKIGLILPRLFEFSEMVKIMTFSYTVFSVVNVFIAMSSVRWGGTADVASPRPRKVGGACRRQVLAGARTQETVGGPNGAQRSEFRRTAPPDNNDIVLSQCFPDMSYISVVGRACMALTMLQGHLTWQRMPFTWWFCYTKMSQMHLHDHVAYPARGI